MAGRGRGASGGHVQKQTNATDAAPCVARVAISRFSGHALGPCAGPPSGASRLTMTGTRHGPRRARRRRAAPMVAVAPALAPALALALALAGCDITGATGSNPATSPGSTRDAPTPALALPIGHAGRWLTDARGRVVLLHGVNER